METQPSNETRSGHLKGPLPLLIIGLVGVLAGYTIRVVVEKYEIDAIKETAWSYAWVKKAKHVTKTQPAVADPTPSVKTTK